MKLGEDLFNCGGRTEIWYMKPEYFRSCVFGYEHMKRHGKLPDKDNLSETHVLLGVIPETDEERIFSQLQGEMWSPKGQARKFISSKGLQHTSMSIGDIIRKEDGEVCVVDTVGWRELE